MTTPIPPPASNELSERLNTIGVPAAVDAMIENASVVLVPGKNGRSIRFQHHPVMRPRTIKLDDPPGATATVNDRVMVWKVLVEGGVWLRLANKPDAAQFDSFTDAYLAAASAGIVPSTT